VRLFTFGVGYDVNTRLLDRVATENGGTSDYVEPQEDLEVKVSSFFDKVNHPVLTNLRLDLGEVRTDLVYPRALPDLFKGTQVALVGRYRNERDLRNVTARLTGNASPARTFTYPGLRFPLRDERHDFLPRLWATRRVGWLLEQVRTNGESRELREEIVDLGTRFGIVTPYTSFLALEPGAEQDASGPTRPRDRRDGRPQPMPNVMSAPPPSAPPPPAAVSGQGAVREARANRARQEALTLEGLQASAAGSAGEEAVRRVGSKTFYNREGVWTDAELKPDARLPETSVRFGSDEYFALLRRVPELARWFALGERVAVVHDGRVYRSTADASP
jgi:Ca-activated chloride channel family protein